MDQQEDVEKVRILSSEEVAEIEARKRAAILAALSTFYDWLIAEYLPENSPVEPASSHPLDSLEPRGKRSMIILLRFVAKAENTDGCRLLTREPGRI